MTNSELNIFRDSLGISESGGKYNKDLGQYWGKYQFGEARRKDIEKILGLPHLTRDQFTPEVQEQFFNVHVQDYENRIFKDGLDKYFGGQIIGRNNKISSTINKYGLLAGAHLGGYEGMKKYFRTNGTFDPADDLGTAISDYIAKFSAISEKKTSLRKLT